jgi:hypothetical protein
MKFVFKQRQHSISDHMPGSDNGIKKGATANNSRCHISNAQNEMTENGTATLDYGANGNQTGEGSDTSQNTYDAWNRDRRT